MISRIFDTFSDVQRKAAANTADSDRSKTLAERLRDKGPEVLLLGVVNEGCDVVWRTLANLMRYYDAHFRLPSSELLPRAFWDATLLRDPVTKAPRVSGDYVWSRPLDDLPRRVKGFKPPLPKSSTQTMPGRSVESLPWPATPSIASALFSAASSSRGPSPDAITSSRNSSASGTDRRTTTSTTSSRNPGAAALLRTAASAQSSQRQPRRSSGGLFRWFSQQARRPAMEHSGSALQHRRIPLVSTPPRALSVYAPVSSVSAQAVPPKRRALIPWRRASLVPPTFRSRR